MSRPVIIAHNCKHFLWNAPAMPLFIGISFVALILSVQLLIIFRGGTQLVANQPVKQTLSDAR